MSSDISFSTDDLNDSKSAAMKMTDSFYPNGKVVYTNTTQSREDTTSKTLTSADPVKILQGDGIYRNPAFSINGYIQNVQSSMHGVLHMAGDIDDDVKVVDPADPSKYLTGAGARQEIAKQSLLSTGYAPGGFESTVQAMTASVGSGGSGTGSSGDSNGTVLGSNGNPISHSSKGYVTHTDGAVFNGGSRAIALEKELSDQEIKVYGKKIAELHKKANFAGSNVNSFNLDFNSTTYYETVNGKRVPKVQDLTKLGFSINSFGGYKTNGESHGLVDIDSTLIGTGINVCYISAAIIEFLLQLTNKIYIKGGHGSGRGIIGSNFSALTKDNNSVSDHAFGRGFDIDALGNTKETAILLTKAGGAAASKKDYADALHIFMTHVSTMPDYLQPDLIVVSDQLITDLGINEKGLESADSAIRKRYPDLAQHVNFGADGSHTNHIHVSFGPIRAGSFITPEIAAEISGTTTTGTVAVTAALTDKLKKEYITGDAALTWADIYTLLNVYGYFGPEVSALFTTISERESRGNPWATNDDGFFGLWQLGTDPKEGGTTNVRLKLPSEEVTTFWKLGCNVWREKGLTAETVDEFINPIRKADSNAGRAYFDKRYSIPLNQIQCLRAKFGYNSKNTKPITKIGTKKSNNILHPWGEGFLYFGWLSGVKYSIGKDVYIQMTGKTEQDFITWLTKNTPKDSRTLNPDPKTGKTILQSWIEGKDYPILYKRQGLWGKSDERPNGWPEIYVDNTYPVNPTPN
jgi:hypothetical protein